MIRSRRFAALLVFWAICAGSQIASAQSVDHPAVSWFADVFHPLFGTGGSRGTMTFVRGVNGMPDGGVVLGGSVAPTDTTFIFQMTLHADSRSLTTVGVQGADVTAAGWFPGIGAGFEGAALAFNDVQIVLQGPLAGGGRSALFFVSFSAVPVGTVLAYWVVEEGAGARIFIGNAMVVVAPTEPPREALVLYDDFENGSRIDADKWFGGGGGRPALDVRRVQVGGQLRMLNQSYATRESNAGSQTGQVFLGFANPETVTAIQATLAVDEVELRGCGGNPEPAWLAAQIFGSFFNQGIPLPNSHVGDIAVSVDVSRTSDSTDPRRVLRINAAILACVTANCAQANSLAGTTLGTVLRGEAVTLRVEWDPGNDRFIFQRDGGPEVALSYTVPDRSAPGVANKIFAVNSTVPNCAAASRPTTRGRIALERVWVNESAVR